MTASNAAPPLVSAIAALRHPNLVPLRHRPGDAQLEPDTADCRSLSELYDEDEGPHTLSLPSLLRVLLDVLNGLEALQGADLGIDGAFAHGRLTPEVVYLSRSGVARLLPLPPTKSAQGSAYLAPEKLLGDPIEPQSDVYSLGVMLWEALTGTRLFAGMSSDAIVMVLMAGKVPFPHPRGNAPWAVPLGEIAKRALSVDPRRRYRDAHELRAAIETVAQGHLASRAQLASLVEHFDEPARTSVTDPGAVPPRASAPATPFRLPPKPLPPPPRKSSLSALVAPIPPAPASLDARELMPASTGAPPFEAPPRRRAVGVALASAAIGGLLVGLVVTQLPRISATLGRSSLTSANLPPASSNDSTLSAPPSPESSAARADAPPAEVAFSAAPALPSAAPEPAPSAVATPVSPRKHVSNRPAPVRRGGKGSAPGAASAAAAAATTSAPVAEAPPPSAESPPAPVAAPPPPKPAPKRDEERYGI